jgi:exopolyphosphatase/guanosine-5'-triphosphate,3'-diphosphate pyrophosphatase
MRAIPAKRSGFMAIVTFAAINVGSNELEMKIFELSVKYGIKEIDHIRHAVELGKDTYNNGKISFKLVDEICKVLKDFRRIMSEYRVDAYRACATSAMREAGNMNIILDQIRIRTGIEVQVLSNSEQRLLCYKSIAGRENDFNKIIQKSTAIVDVGAGSVQISLFDKDALVATQNVKLGSLRLREMLANIEEEGSDFYKLVDELINNDLETFIRVFLKEKEVRRIIAVGEYMEYLVHRVNGGKVSSSITRAEFIREYENLSVQNPDRIAEILDISKERATQFLPAMMVYKNMIEKTDTEIIWTPGINLCDGMAFDYGEKNVRIKLSHDFSEDILAASRNMAKRFLGNKKHTQMLEELVLRLFDATKKYHGMGKRERLLLQISAILHDCGKYISMATPAECSYHIIMSTEIIGLSHRERMMVANIVKYNTAEFQYYDELEDRVNIEDYYVIAKLTALLRVANAMDRSHKQKFKNLKFQAKERELVITTETMDDITLERGLFESKADFFEEVFGVRPILKQKRSI